MQYVLLFYSMRVIHPSVHLKQHERGRRGRRRRAFFIVLLVLLIASYGGLASQVKATYVSNTYDVSIGRQFIDLPWPALGAAAVGFTDSSQVVSQFNGTTKLPSASTIKTLTALVVLNAKPLVGEGELIAFDGSDEAYFNSVQSAGGAAVRIPAGTSITYLKALEIMLLSSANNVADKLAIWGFGSMENYVNAATIYAADNGLKSTVVVDASGLSPETKSSANDLVKIGLKALDNTVIGQIVKTETITLADGQVIDNTNVLLGVDGFNGLKTGFTDEAGACLIASKAVVIGGKTIQAVSVVMGQPDRTAAYATSRMVMDEFLSNFTQKNMLAKGQVIGDYTSPWGTKTPIRVREPLSVVSYDGLSVGGVSNLDKTIGYAKAGTKVGVFRVDDTEVEVELAEDLPSPSISWRLIHLVDYIREKV